MIIIGQFFLFLHKNICCGYSLEVPHQGASNEYPQHMFYGELTYVVDTHKKHLTKALLMSTHNICFYGELEKIIIYSSLTIPVCV